MIFGEKNIDTPIRWGMVGGGRGSQIGYIHRSAALRDFNFELVAGAFDIVPERGIEFGENCHVAADRCYPDYQTMFEAEAKRPDGIQTVSIATPNFTHYEIAKAALEAGLHVYCEKPLCFTSEQAEELEALVKKSGKIMFVSYGYAGHQMIEQARKMVENGDLGKIRIINMQFAHGVNAGEQFGFRIRIVGEKASVAWDAEKPNYLSYEVQGESPRMLSRGNGYLYPEALADDRIGGGHPEGLFEAWSNLYTKFAIAIDRCEKGETVDFWYPDIHAGVLGVKWVEKCVESADKDSAWITF